MGNSQSDIGEQRAYDDVLRHIPIFSQAYSAFRAAVYAGKGDTQEAEWSGKGMIYGFQHLEKDIPDAIGKKANETWLKVQDKAIKAVKEKAEEKVGVIAAAGVGLVAFTTAIWYWSSSRSEKRTRRIIREELSDHEERVGIFRRRAAK